MNSKNAQGYTKTEELEQVINSTPADSTAHITACDTLDNQPLIPYCFQHIWKWFLDLNSKRDSGFEGPKSISYTEVYAWNKLKQIDIQDFELDILFLIDNVFMENTRKKINKKQNQKQPIMSKGRKKR